MKDRQTNTIVQVCKATDQKEKAPGPYKTGPPRCFCWGWGRTACMGEEKNEKYCELRDGSGR